MTFFDFMARSCLSPQCFAALVHVKGVARKVVDWCSKTPSTIVETLMSTISPITFGLGSIKLVERCPPDSFTHALSGAFKRSYLFAMALAQDSRLVFVVAIRERVKFQQ